MDLRVIGVLCLIAIASSTTPEEELHGVKYADNCEACKILATELQARLTETGKTHETLQFGYSLDGDKRKMEYKKSMLRLIESTEDACEKVLEYNIHKERKDSTRFAKGMSETFSTLHGLVDKGVKVELGIPYELWDKPSAEITQMKSQCEMLLERHDEDIEDWYFNHQEEAPLIDFLCRDRVLAKKDSGCLYEVLKPKGESGDNEDEEKSESDAEPPKKPKKKKPSKDEDDGNAALPKVEL